MNPDAWGALALELLPYVGPAGGVLGAWLIRRANLPPLYTPLGIVALGIAMGLVGLVVAGGQPVLGGINLLAGIALVAIGFGSLAGQIAE
jgi:hypothetical protein